MNRLLTLTAASLVLAASAFAQNAAGTLDGRVNAAPGSAIPGAAVTIENQATNVRLSQQTNSEGRFYQRYLLPGAYQLTVEKTGLQKYVQTGILVDVEQTVTLTIPMKVGDVATTVEVEANAA